MSRTLSCSPPQVVNGTIGWNSARFQSIHIIISSTLWQSFMIQPCTRRRFRKINPKQCHFSSSVSELGWYSWSLNFARLVTNLKQAKSRKAFLTSWSRFWELNNVASFAGSTLRNSLSFTLSTFVKETFYHKRFSHRAIVQLNSHWTFDSRSFLLVWSLGSSSMDASDSVPPMCIRYRRLAHILLAQWRPPNQLLRHQRIAVVRCPLRLGSERDSILWGFVVWDS